MNQSPRVSWIRRTLAEQPAVLVSAMYLFASLIGLVYSWAFLRPFGINMLQYAEISDFLLASVKEPLTWGLALVAVALVQLDNMMSRRVESRGPGRLLRWYGSSRYRRFNYIVSIMVVTAFLFVYADINAERVLGGEGERFEVQLADGSDAQTRVLLGTTVNFIFVYEHDSRRVMIHPNESVISLSRSASTRQVAETDSQAGSQADTAKEGGGSR